MSCAISADAMVEEESDGSLLVIRHDEDDIMTTYLHQQMQNGFVIAGTS